jgi:acrylyl-CoA reductase (NADPH)
VCLQAWSRLARDLDPNKLARMTRVIGLAVVPKVGDRVLDGKFAIATVGEARAVLSHVY